MTAADSATKQSDAMWDGDHTFNIYIYDYCKKRGFQKSAAEFQIEANIPKDGKPPIDAAQGLLFEWWSVFWLLFTAKGNPSGSTEDAVVYQQYQAQQRARAASGSSSLSRASYSNGIGNGVGALQRQPGPPPIGAPVINGIQPGIPLLPNGLHHQGMVMPQGPGVPQPMGYPAVQAQPNGVVGQSMSMVGQAPVINHNQYIQPMRQGSISQPGQLQGRPNAGPPPGMPPQYAPHMSQPQGGPAPTPTPYQQGRRTPGAGNPPNAPSPLNPNHQTPGPQYSNLGGRPASRTGGPETPRSASIVQQSPSLANRLPPQQSTSTTPQQQQQQPPQQHQAPPPPMDDSMRQLAMQQQQEIDSTMQALNSMTPANFNDVMQRAGLQGKAPANLTVEEKIRLSQFVRPPAQGVVAQRKAGANNSAPSTPNRGSMQPPANLPNARGVKRNSSSPATENETLPQKDQSPRQLKRSRPSPNLKQEGSPSLFPGGGNNVMNNASGSTGPLLHQGTNPQPPQNGMPNGIQRQPLNNNPPNGAPMPPIPMTMQPNPPMSHLQPNTMVNPPAGTMLNPNPMMMQPTMPGPGGQYYRNIPGSNQHPPASSQQQQQQQPPPPLQQQQPSLQPKNMQSHPTNEASAQPFSNSGMITMPNTPQGRGPQSGPNIMKMPTQGSPANNLKQEGPSTQPQMIPTNATGAPSGVRDNGGSNSAPPTTGTSPLNAGSAASSTPSLTAATTTTAPTTPGSQPTFTNAASPTRAPDLNAMGSLPRPATAPVDLAPPSAGLPELFTGVDMMGFQSFETGGLLGSGDFGELDDYTQWINSDMT